MITNIEIHGYMLLIWIIWIILDQFLGIQGPSGWEIGQIWVKIAKIAEKFTEIS